jgi:trehalose 6-phosphate phosphatase
MIPHASAGVTDWLAARRACGQMLLALDFDGTLSPIAPTPAAATLPEDTRAALHDVAARSDTILAVVSGRALEDVFVKVRMPELYYAGNHGLEIRGPALELVHPEAVARVAAVRQCLERLRPVVGQIEGVVVEDKRLSLSIHYRLVREPALEELVRDAVRSSCNDIAGLKVTEGKKLIEVRPDVAWDKGRAVEFLVASLLNGSAAPVLFIGDDVTDEDGFRAIAGRGAGILVAEPTAATQTAASYYLSSTDEVTVLLRQLAEDSPGDAGARPWTTT